MNVSIFFLRKGAIDSIYQIFKGVPDLKDVKNSDQKTS